MINEFKKIKTRDDVELNALVLESGKKTWLIHLHDFGENIQRHHSILDPASRFYNILQVDLREHGNSGGVLSEMSDFRVLTKDLEDCIIFLQNNYAMNEFNLIGHGLGGLIICDYLQNFAKIDRYPGKVFLQGPLLFLHGTLGQILGLTEKFVFSVINKISIDVKIPNFIDAKKLSHDGRVFQSVQLDKTMKTSISSSFLLMMLATMRDIATRPLRANCHLAVALAGEDYSINVGMVQNYFQQFEKTSKILVIDGAYKELHHEVEMFRYPYEEFFKDFIFEKSISRKLLV